MKDTTAKIRRPVRSRFHLPRTVRTAEGKPSAYTITDNPHGGYTIAKNGAPLWTHDGYAITSSAGVASLPAYVAAEVERQHSADYLLAILRPAKRTPGQTYIGADGEPRITSPSYTHSPRSRVRVVQRSVSRSGMVRQLSLFGPGMEPLTFHAARILREPLTRGWHDSLKVTGCGMDMHFATVYDLAAYLYGEGYALTSETI